MVIVGEEQRAVEVVVLPLELEPTMEVTGAPASGAEDETDGEHDVQIHRHQERNQYTGDAAEEALGDAVGVACKWRGVVVRVVVAVYGSGIKRPRMAEPMFEVLEEI